MNPYKQLAIEALTTKYRLEMYKIKNNTRCMGIVKVLLVTQLVIDCHKQLHAILAAPVNRNHYCGCKNFTPYIAEKYRR